MRRLARTLALLAAVATLAVACGDDGTSSSAPADGGTTTAPAGDGAVDTTVPADPVQVLVTNDDGVDAEGIDALVQGLEAVDGIEVTVVAPATNQSGTGGTLTDGPLTASETTTASGHAATAIEGTPADTIVWAVDQGGLPSAPDLVISGINAGQNMGPFVELSGTVGAARAAAQRGIPALAASQGQLEPPHDWPTGVEHVLDWLDENLDAIRAGTLDTTTIANLNIPTCSSGEPRGEVDVPLAATADGYGDQPDCASTATDPADDIAAFLAGYVTLTPVSATAAS